MNRLMQWVMAAALICGATLFTSCSNDDNPATPDLNLSEKIKADYAEPILGTWEGHVTNSEGSEFDDGETHRWEYKADGTYVYYVKDGDDWVPSANDLNEYFVDGILLATRWIDNDVENREWWEIASIKDGVMKWKGLRQKEDGSTYTATFEMKKVE